MRNQFGPMFANGSGHRSSHQPKVASLVIRPDEPQPVAMVHRVLVLILARTDDPEFTRRLVSRQNASLIRRVAARLHNDVLPVPSSPCAKVEPLVVILVDQHVLVVLLRAIVPPQLKLPLLLLVLDRIKER